MGGNYLNMLFREIYKIKTIHDDIDYSTLDINTLNVVKTLIQNEMQTVVDNEKDYAKQGQYRAAADSRYEYNGLCTALDLVHSILTKLKNS